MSNPVLVSQRGGHDADKLAASSLCGPSNRKVNKTRKKFIVEECLPIHVVERQHLDDYSRPPQATEK
jgi:hypothetical protein